MNLSLIAKALIMRSYNKLPAFVVDTKGKVRQIIPDNEKHFTLKEIQYYIGTNTPAFLKTSDGKVIICCATLQANEAERRNVVASLLYMHSDQHQIHGMAIVCESKFIH